MKLKFLHKRKEEKQTEEEAFFLPTIHFPAVLPPAEIYH